MTSIVNTKGGVGCRLCVIVAYFLISLSACARLGGVAESVPPLVLTPPSASAVSSLNKLLQVEPPERDMVALLSGFQGDAIPRLAQVEATAYQVGDMAPFWVTNNDDGRNRQLEARLVYRSDALNLWLESGQRFDEAKMEAAAQRIETDILPVTRNFFGTEWQPGVDGDNRVNILHATELGSGVAAYFSAADEVVTAVNPFPTNVKCFMSIWIMLISALMSISTPSPMKCSISSSGRPIRMKMPGWVKV